MTQFVDGHLGGYVVGGDDATYYPELWEWLVTTQGVRSVLDVGCGEGHSLQYFRGLGCDVTGIDGVPQADPDIVEHDYTLGPWVPWEDNVVRRYDLCWSCEFVEHVDEAYVKNFLPTFRQADLVLMTHAEPRQAGHHHVNCQFSQYWMGAMAGIGYRYDPKLTYMARHQAGMNRSPWNHFLRSGLAFRMHTHE